MQRGIIFILLLLLAINSKAQTWPKIFGIAEAAWSYDVAESYDGGYLILNQVNPGTAGVSQMHTWLIKTDINGNRLWDKRIYKAEYLNSCNDITPTPDGGCILVGSTSKLEVGETDIFFIKLDACYQREWCTILATPGNSDYGNKVLPVEDGYVALVNYYQDWVNKRVWTIKLDLSGNVVWRKAYFQDDPGYRNEEARGLTLASDGGLLVTADGWYDPQGGWNGWLRSILIKTDPFGNEQWITRWGEDQGFFSLLPAYPSISSNGVYYSAVTHYANLPVEGYVPAFYRTLSNGEEAGYVDVLTGTESGIMTTLHFLYPDTLLMACGWNFPQHDYSQGVAKSDTAGNHIQVKILIDSVMNTFRGSAITFDHKMVLVGGFTKLNNTSDVYLFKINSNLELDSAYTAPRTYDSLCPHPIASDTLDLDGCGIYTALPDPQVQADRYKIRAFPIPAKDVFTVLLPEQLTTARVLNGVSIQTVWHQWDKASLQIVDMSGRQVYGQLMYFNKRETEINCSHWPAGMYLARLTYNSLPAGEAKILIAK